MNNNYYKKYIKYKKKYLQLKNMIGGSKKDSKKSSKKASKKSSKKSSKLDIIKKSDQVKYLDEFEQLDIIKESSGLPIEIIKSSEYLLEIEELMIKDLKKLFEKYEDLKKYIYTNKILVDPNVKNFSHSHPILTISRRYITKKYPEEILLATFIHEQFHWWSEQNYNKKLKPFIEKILYKRFPDIRTEYPHGSGNKFGTYNHIVVCFYEYKVLKELIDPKIAKEIIENMPGYYDIYKTVLKDFEQIEDLLKEHDLLP